MQFKHLRGLSTLVLLLLAGQSIGQITITKANYPMPAEGYYKDLNFAENPGSFSLPTPGANQTWSYTGFNTAGVNVLKYHATKSGSGFPGSYFYYNSTTGLSIFEIRTSFHFGFDDNGFYKIGRYQNDTTYGLSTVTGGPGDQINFPTATILYKERATTLKFPLTYQTTWKHTYRVKTPFNLTVAAYGLNNVPGETRNISTENFEVIGHGMLTMKDTNGADSKPMDVLLLKNSMSVTDSFYLGGADAPKALLDVFGLAQGQTNEYETYYVYRAGYGEPLINFTVDPTSGEITKITYNPKGATPMTTGLSSVMSSVMNVYPNPVMRGSALKIDVKDNQNTMFVLKSLDGKVIMQQRFTPVVGESTVNVEMPNDLSTGMYIYQITENNGSLVSGLVNIIE